MKKALILTVTTGILAGCCQPAAVRFTLTGSDPLFEEGKYVYVQDENGKTSDSARIENHGFTIKGTHPWPAEVYLYMETEQVGYNFFLENGTIRIERHGGTFDDFIYTGTPQNDLKNEMDRQYVALHRSGRPVMEVSKATDSLLRATALESKDILGLSLLREELIASLPAEEVLRLADAFPQSYQRHPYMLELRETAKNLRTDIGKPYIDIAGINQRGDSVSLSSVVKRPGNRYVILEFTSSWCGGCKRDAPIMVRTYEKYHDKGFDIFGVSFDSSKKQWLAGLDKFGIEWAQVLADPELHPRMTKEWQDYSLNGIPVHFLIDCSTGLIISKNLYEEAIFEKIAELLD